MHLPGSPESHGMPAKKIKKKQHNNSKMRTSNSLQAYEQNEPSVHMLSHLRKESGVKEQPHKSKMVSQANLARGHSSTHRSINGHAGAVQHHLAEYKEV